jgi:hypothetical protein
MKPLQSQDFQVVQASYASISVQLEDDETIPQHKEVQHRRILVRGSPTLARERWNQLFNKK